MVPKNWEHPKRENGSYQPMYKENYDIAFNEWKKEMEQWLNGHAKYLITDPDSRYYMPAWRDLLKTHYMMYETTSEGTPISPSFETPEKLAHWLANNGDSAFGTDTVTYEQWFKMIGVGSACSAVKINGKLISGVEDYSWGIIMDYKETKKMYSEILFILKKYNDCECYEIKQLKYKAECYIYWSEIIEKYGFNIVPDNMTNIDFMNFGQYMSIGKWGKKYKRTISWSDDGRQPEDEVLLQISFSTGAFIFGKDYPTKFLKQFFNELKTYNPKYIDTHNKNLYFSMDNAACIFNSFNNIYDKYIKLNKEDRKKRDIIKLKEKIKSLEKEL